MDGFRRIGELPQGILELILISVMSLLSSKEQEVLEEATLLVEARDLLLPPRDMRRISVVLDMFVSTLRIGLDSWLPRPPIAFRMKVLDFEKRL